MRAILLVLAACGRIGFGAGGGGGGNGDGATGDGPDAHDIVVSLSATGDCPSIAWNGSQLGIAWRDVDAVWFAIVDANAATVRTPAPIINALQNLGCPTVTWTGTTFVVAYSSGALGKGDIDIASIQDATVTMNNVARDSGDSQNPRLCGDGTGALVAWLDRTGSNYNVFVRAIDGSGVPIGTVQTPSNNDGSSPDAAFTGTTFAVAWSAGTLVNLRQVSPDGALASPTTSFAATEAVNPVAVAWTGNDVVLSWRQFAPDGFFVARENLTGTLTLMPRPLDPQAVRARSIVWTGHGFAMLWVDMYSLVEYNFALLDGGGAFLHQEKLSVPHPDTGSLTSLAWTGERYLTALNGLNGGVTLRSFVRM